MPPIAVRAAEPDDADAFGGRCEIQVAVAADGRLAGGPAEDERGRRIQEA